MSIKFSELTAETNLGANDIFPFVPVGGASAKKVAFSALKNAITPAKVYRASLTQGGDLSGEYETYSFIVGHLYILDQWGGDDFSNIGFVSNGVPFIATGTTPSTWEGDSQEIYDLTPNVVVHENTLGFSPSFVWSSVGVFTIPEVVDDGKTILKIGPLRNGNEHFAFAELYFDESNGDVATLATKVLSADLGTGDLISANEGNLLKSTWIEILRYP